MMEMHAANREQLIRDVGRTTENLGFHGIEIVDVHEEGSHDS